MVLLTQAGPKLGMERGAGRLTMYFVVESGLFWDFPGGLVVRNPPSNAGDESSIPGQGIKIPHAMGQLSPCATTTEPARFRASAPQLESPCARYPPLHN